MDTVCHQVIEILYCSRHYYIKDIFKVDMIQVYWCACYDVPLSFHLAFSGMIMNLRLHETYLCLESS